MRCVVAGNYSLDPSTVAMHLLRQLAELPIDSQVLLRLPLTGHPGPVENLTNDLCQSLSIIVEWFLPAPNTGGEGTIDRDRRMVDDCDEVIAYFHPDHTMDEERGTTRLVRLALSLNKPVRAYSPSEDGMHWVGSDEPEVSHAQRA